MKLIASIGTASFPQLFWQLALLPMLPSSLSQLLRVIERVPVLIMVWPKHWRCKRGRRANDEAIRQLILERGRWPYHIPPAIFKIRFTYISCSFKPYCTHGKPRKEPFWAGHPRRNSFDCLLFLYDRLRKHVFSYSNGSRALATPPPSVFKGTPFSGNYIVS